MIAALKGLNCGVTEIVTYGIIRNHRTLNHIANQHIK